MREAGLPSRSSTDPAARMRKAPAQWAPPAASCLRLRRTTTNVPPTATVTTKKRRNAIAASLFSGLLAQTQDLILNALERRGDIGAGLGAEILAFKLSSFAVLRRRVVRAPLED